MSGEPTRNAEGTRDAEADRRPGPAVLYGPPVTPPQQETEGRWTADPLLVSGTDAHVDGEYVYQDYVYDDKGAAVGDDDYFPPPPEPPQPVPNPSLVSHSTGRFVYPTDVDTYGYNAADLLEFRAQPVEAGVAYRITLQTMKEPDAAAVAIGIDTGGDSGTDDWGYGVGKLGDLGLDHVLTTWGTGAELDGERLPDDRISVDVERNRIEVTVPLDPGEETWRHYAVVGLWDDETGTFKDVADRPTEHTPGGAHGTDPPPVFNVAFRFDEPIGVVDGPVRLPGMPPGETRETARYGQRREHAQATALAERDISAFGADVDFGALAAGDTRSSVPESGFTNRLYASRYSLGEGVRKGYDPTSDARPSDDRSRFDLFENRVQPYGLYVPEGYDPDEAHPLHVHLHGGSASHNTTGVRENFLRQLGEERNALVLSPEGRGPGVFYKGPGELDVLEAMADVLSRFAVDTDRITVSGVSMGGYGTFRFASRYPDLFAKAFPIVGSYWPDGEHLLDSLRHVPVLMWNALQDELAIPANFLPAAVGLEERGYRHELNLFLRDGHTDSVRRDEWTRPKAFLEGEYLGEATVEHSPSRVTYTRIPDIEAPNLDLVHDGAYWIDDIQVADGAAHGTVDASFADSPEPAHYTDFREDPVGHAVIGTRWAAADDELEASASAPALRLDLDDVTGVTVDLDAADVDLNATDVDLDAADVDTDSDLAVTVEATHEATVRFESDAGTTTVEVPAGTSEHAVELG